MMPSGGNNLFNAQRFIYISEIIYIPDLRVDMIFHIQLCYLS